MCFLRSKLLWTTSEIRFILFFCFACEFLLVLIRLYFDKSLWQSCCCTHSERERKQKKKCWKYFRETYVQCVCVRNSCKVLTAPLTHSFPSLFAYLCEPIWKYSPLSQNTTCKHPIVMLAGVSASDLEALLEFVYRGEVSVDHSQLPSLLQAAQCLNIQGLAPQTVTHKDDTAYTSIQIHPGLVHQDVKTHILEVGGNMVNRAWRLTNSLFTDVCQLVCLLGRRIDHAAAATGPNSSPDRRRNSPGTNERWSHQGSHQPILTAT